MRICNSLALCAATLTVACSLLSLPARADTKCFIPPGQSVTGPITHYVDGDTFDMGPNRIRPWGINSAEEGQKGYDEATAELISITKQKALSCFVRYLDRTQSHRCVSSCTIDGVVDLGEALLRSGWVKIHPRYIKEDPAYQQRYEAAEQQAKTAKRGLWR